MGDYNVSRVGDTHAVPWVAAGSDGPDLANDEIILMSDGTVPTAVADIPLGVMVDTRPSDNPPDQGTVYGDGSIIEDLSASFTVDELVWHDGDGTWSQTKPGSSAGNQIVKMGVAITSTKVLIDIEAYERGA